MNIVPVFHPPKFCYFLKFLIVRFFVFVFVFYVVTLTILLMPIYKLYFQIVTFLFM